MPMPSIRPWRDHGELLEVRGLLYPADGIDVDERARQNRLGINIINIWKRRTRLPHAVFSTAFLIDAILVHEELSSRSDGTSSVIISPLTIRSLYATAIARFVTGLCDTAQNAAVKRSMYDMATELGIPERWVEIRHEITHGQIPDLKALEECAREGVAWLWEVFWSRLDVKGRADDREKKKVELSGLLRTYLKERRNDIRSGKNGDPGGTVKTVLGYAKADKDLRIVAEVLVEDKLMLPNQKSSEVNMNAAFLIWDKLLLKLTEQRPSFFESLLRSIQTALDSSFHMSSDSTLEKDTIHQWQWHLLSSKKWQSSQQHFWQSEDFPSELIEACYLNPNPWTQQLAKLLLGQGEDDFRQNWTAMYNASFGVNPPEEIERNDRDDEDEKMGDTEQESPLAVDSDSDVEHSGCGWKLLDGPWIPRAIGV